ncbi:MAG: phosphoenolpyruvate carboxykinase [Firmicutes bacterium]|nr:phosphoenolpyruvate carboxykinase [Bacillota bacterium]
MKTTREQYLLSRGKVIFDYSTLYCATPEELLRSGLFKEITERFVAKIASKGSSTFAFLSESLPYLKKDELAGYMINLLRLLSSHTTEEILSMNSEYNAILSDKERVLEFIEGLYNYWRGFERFIYMEAPKRSQYTKNSLHHAQFIKSNEEFKNLILSVYRRIGENLIGENPRVYRQLPAGANMGLLCEKIDWDCPKTYSNLQEIPFIRLTLLEPPVIFYPRANKRKGRFEEIGGLEKEMLDLNPEEWFCYPAKVGDLIAFIYFHHDFMSLGLSLCNLFEIADYEEIEANKPNIMLVFGLDNGNLPSKTVFYEDLDNDILVGLIQHSEDVDYFGYFKKMTLTLHNIAMLKRKRLPVHGAMVYLKLKEGGTANVVIIGDSGAGKSETIEALRVLADEYICEMIIVFDDMGSLGIDAGGNVVGYGTEIGAFVRLDDLQPGYAYEEIDRSIFMNPDKTNARLIMPITRYSHIIKGYPVDILLYANNYDQVNEENRALEFFSTPDDALAVFKSGARLAKGTTDEKGLVHTYFANPFGAPQRRQEHEACAKLYFEKMFELGVKVGQIRTRLGIDGYEQEGPRVASLELFNVIKQLSTN